MEFLSSATIDRVRDAAAALRRVRRLRSAERAALVQTLHDAEQELSSRVRAAYPGLMQYLLRAPSWYRYDATRGYCGWRSAAALARAAERWVEIAPRVARARISEAYGVVTPYAELTKGER